MDFIKDLVFVSLFLTIVIKYIVLYRNSVSERNFFINTLSHDLRVATIAQIRGIELIDKNCKDKELVSEINKSCRFSLEMINMLLNTYHYKNGERNLHYEKFDICELINNTCQKVSETSAEKTCKFYYNKPESIILDADKDGIFKVMKTLLSISVNNAKKESVIFIKTKKVINSLEINIIYQGKTLTKDQCKNMFLYNPKFSTVGHNIKMDLIRRIVESHSGKVFVKNLSKELISFCFTIPISKSNRKQREIKVKV